MNTAGSMALNLCQYSSEWKPGNSRLPQKFNSKLLNIQNNTFATWLPNQCFNLGETQQTSNLTVGCTKCMVINARSLSKPDATPALPLLEHWLLTTSCLFCLKDTMTPCLSTRMHNSQKRPTWFRNRRCSGDVRELMQQDGWKAQEGRMTKNSRSRPGMHSLGRHFFIILPSWVIQPSCCVRSLFSVWRRRLKN